MKEPQIEFYFCRDFSTNSEHKVYHVTPKEYFDKRGFLYDSGSFDPGIQGFQRIADSTFEYIGTGNPVKVLLMDGRFAWRDMVGEIQHKYVRRRYLGIDDQE